MRTSNLRTALAALLLVPVLAACGAADGPAADVEPVDGTEVAVRDNAFGPQAVRVEPGEQVTWTWEGDNPHDVVFDDARSEVQQDGTWQLTFDEPGTYEFTCSVHPNMQGKVVVEAA